MELPTMQSKSAPPFTSRSSYQLAKSFPSCVTDSEGCHCMAVPESVFNFNGVPQVRPASVERINQMSPWSAAPEQTVLPPEPQAAQFRKTLLPLAAGSPQPICLQMLEKTR